MTKFKAGICLSDLRLLLYIHQRAEREGFICVLDELVLIFLQLRMSLISVFSLVLDVPVPATCAELFDVGSIL